MHFLHTTLRSHNPATLGDESPRLSLVTVLHTHQHFRTFSPTSVDYTLVYSRDKPTEAEPKLHFSPSATRAAQYTQASPFGVSPAQLQGQTLLVALHAQFLYTSRTFVTSTSITCHEQHGSRSFACSSRRPQQTATADGHNRQQRWHSHSRAQYIVLPACLDIHTSAKRTELTQLISTWRFYPTSQGSSMMTIHF